MDVGDISGFQLLVREEETILLVIHMDETCGKYLFF